MSSQHRIAEGYIDPASYYAPSDNVEFTQQVGHLLRCAYQRHTALFQRESSDPQLTSVQFVTLSTLETCGPSSLTDLVKATSIDPATLRGIIKRLHNRHWIETSSDPGDQRKVIVELTSPGRALLNEMTPRAQRVSAMTMKELNPAERVALIHLLEKMTASDVDPYTARRGSALAALEGVSHV